MEDHYNLDIAHEHLKRAHSAARGHTEDGAFEPNHEYHNEMSMHYLRTANHHIDQFSHHLESAPEVANLHHKAAEANMSLYRHHFGLSKP